MEQPNTFKDEHPFHFMVVVGALLFCAGLVIGLVANTNQTSTTPQACHEVLELDEEIIMTVGTRIGEYDFQAATDYINGVRDKRATLYAECLGS